MKAVHLVCSAITLSLSLLAWSTNKLPDGHTFIQMCMEKDQYLATWRLEGLLRGSDDDSKRNWLNSVEVWGKNSQDPYWKVESETPLKCKTPLHIAAEYNCSRMVLTLLKHGAKVEAKTLCNDNTPLHLAVEKGHIAIVIRLLAYGANIEERSWCGWTPMHSAAMGNAPEHRRIISLFMAHQADIEVKNDYGSSPLYIAVRNGNIKTVEHLLAFRANQTRLFRGITTTLIEAVIRKNKELVRVLLESLPDTDEKYQHIHFRGHTGNEEFRPGECRGTDGYQEPKELPTAVEIAQDQPEILALLHAPPVYNVEKIQRHRRQCTPNLRSLASFQLWLASSRNFARLLQYLNNQPQLSPRSRREIFYRLGFVELYDNVQSGFEEVVYGFY